MLNILIFTLFFIFLLLNLWSCFISISPFHDYDLKKLNAILNYIKKPSKPSVSLNKSNFWCVFTIFIFHLFLIVSSNLVINKLPLITSPTEIQMIISIVLAIFGISCFIAYKGVTNDILLELDRSIRHSSIEEIIYWINTYKKMPFVLKMALKQNKNNLFINVYHSMTLHNKLQDQLPEKIEKVKSIKRNKI